MKRPIKFRGRAKGGRTLFGDIRRLNGEWFMFNGDFWYEADEDSIAQLVGYDKDGKEIYEGDTVVSEYGDSVIARLVDNLPPKSKLQEAEK